jgi:hypothetical protein
LAASFINDRQMKLLGLLILTSTIAIGQDDSNKFKTQILTSQYLLKQDVKKEILTYDISAVLTKTANNSIVGFIGKDYQRIRIKFISVVKNQEQQDEYFVYGKSMVKENVCEFQGTLSITNAFYLSDPEVKDVKQGIVIGDYSLFENTSQKHVGLFKGLFKIGWYIDKQGQIQYDDLMIDADGFSNNQFVGTWTAYNGTVSKACNWGDYRIALSGNLDSGAGEFFPDQKYIANGWASYRQAYGGPNDATAEEARKKEMQEWWK